MRDLRYAVGTLLAGLTADAFGIQAAMWLIAVLTLASGAVSAVRMTETLPPRAILKGDREAGTTAGAQQELGPDAKSQQKSSPNAASMRDHSPAA